MSLQRELQLELPLRRPGPSTGAARRHSRAPRKSFVVGSWRDGTILPFLGRKITVRLDAACDCAELVGEALHLPLPPAASEIQIKDRAEAWLQGEARRTLDEHLAACAGRLGVPVPPWQVSFAAGSWGGRDGDGRLRLSWRLVHLTPEEIDRVLLPQLASLPGRAEVRDLWDAPLSA